MMMFVAAARSKVLELTGSTGLTGGFTVNDLFKTKFLRQEFWSAAAKGVGQAGTALMDVGAKIVNLGWRATVFGFLLWAGVGLARHGQAIFGLFGTEVLKSIPPACPSPA